MLGVLFTMDFGKKKTKNNWQKIEHVAVKTTLNVRLLAIFPEHSEK